MNRFVLPLVVFLGLTALLWRGLGLDPRDLPSQLIDREAPAFSLSTVANPAQNISNRTLEGKVWLLNVWASWCVACLQEHSVISALSEQIDIVGLNYKDQRQDAINWLGQHGNPYTVSGFDHAGDVGIDYGVYGVPETFVIDQLGRIRYKHTGPVSMQDMQQTLLPVIASLRSES